MKKLFRRLMSRLAFRKAAQDFRRQLLAQGYSQSRLWSRKEQV